LVIFAVFFILLCVLFYVVLLSGDLDDLARNMVGIFIQIWFENIPEIMAHNLNP
jgi:hypothetical protein